MTQNIFPYRGTLFTLSKDVDFCRLTASVPSSRLPGRRLILRARRLDAYLDIAATVLRSERRPLGPRAILAAAYRYNMVPPHLHGRTQHKTLQARISEDIVAKREQSQFFRTAPGRFFLRELLRDETLPEEFRKPIPTRRRVRELTRGPALAISYDALSEFACENSMVDSVQVMKIFHSSRSSYISVKDKDIQKKWVFVRSFVCVRRDSQILTYRLGRYRDNRDAFMSRRSIGFTTLIVQDEHNLFNVDDFGVIDAGVRATKIDLDIPELSHSLEEEKASATLKYFAWTRYSAEMSDLLAVINFECPSWFEPVKRRLALNDLAWMDLRQPVNDIDDFDPWSKMVLLSQINEFAGRCVDSESSRALSRKSQHGISQNPNRVWRRASV